MEENKLIKMLTEALESAHEHLQYTGYGDSWERENWRKLDNKIVKALNASKTFKPKTKK